MVPVPKKPMPLITWAPRRVTSAIMPTSRWASAQTVDSMAYWYWPSTMASAAPMDTIM